MLTQKVSYSLIASNVALIVASNTPAGAGALTLVSPVTIITSTPTPVGAISVSTPTITLDIARRILVTYTSGEASPRTVVVSGGDRYGNYLSETITVPTTGTTVSSVNDFLTITSVVVAAAWTGAMSVGTSGVGSSAWYFLNQQLTPFNVGIGVTTSGTVNWTIQYTYDNPNAAGLIAATIPQNLWNHATLVNQSGNLDGVFAYPVLAWRLLINSGTGTATAETMQAGVWQ